jgi:GT2 family glycosyltransferase
MTVFITYPHPGLVAQSFAHSLLRITLQHRELIEDICPVRGYPGDGLIVARNAGVDAFLRSRAEWLWTLDTDIGFRPSALQDLLSVGEPVVSGLYYTSWEDGNDGTGAPNWHSSACVWDKNGNEYEDLSGVMEVGYVGAGCLLVHRDVIEKIGSNWWNLKPGKGEDISFCERVREAEYSIYCNTQVRLSHRKAVYL